MNKKYYAAAALMYGMKWNDKFLWNKDDCAWDDCGFISYIMGFSFYILCFMLLLMYSVDAGNFSKEF